MSKFFRTRFHFNNIEAGHISSIPYMIASFAVPVFGSLINRIGEAHYERLIFTALCLVLFTHTSYLLLSDPVDPEEQGGLLCMFPIFFFGFGHALFSTIVGPMVNKTVGNNKSILTNCFSLLKITESTCVMIMTQLTGFLREKTHSFTSVSLLMAFSSIVAMSITYVMIRDSDKQTPQYLVPAELSKMSWKELKTLVTDKLSQFAISMSDLVYEREVQEPKAPSKALVAESKKKEVAPAEVEEEGK